MTTRLAFVELTVSRWSEAVAWYRDVLGLAVALFVEKDSFALFRAGGGQLALKAGISHPGTVLLTFEVDDLDREADRLQSLGVVISPTKTSDEGYRRILLEDPDGHRLCLFERTAPEVSSPSAS